MTKTTGSVEDLQQMLIGRYGPLLRHEQVAEVLDVSPGSLGNTLRLSQEPNVVYLKLKKLRFGRRVRYSAVSVAEALALNPGELEQRLTVLAGGSGDNKRQR